MSRGAEAFKGELAERVEREDAEDQELSEVVAARLHESHIASLMGTALFDLLRIVPETPVIGQTRWDYVPATVTRLASALELPEPKVRGHWQDIVDKDKAWKRWAKAGPETRVDVVAELLVWQLRHSSEDSELVTKFLESLRESGEKREPGSTKVEAA